MSITNTSKPTTTLTNTTRVSFGELWSTITTTWQNESRSWLVVGSLIGNSTRVSSSMINIIKPL